MRTSGVLNKESVAKGVNRVVHVVGNITIFILFFFTLALAAYWDNAIPVVFVPAIYVLYKWGRWLVQKLPIIIVICVIFFVLLASYDMYLRRTVSKTTSCRLALQLLGLSASEIDTSVVQTQECRDSAAFVRLIAANTESCNYTQQCADAEAQLQAFYRIPDEGDVVSFQLKRNEIITKIAAVKTQRTTLTLSESVELLFFVAVLFSLYDIVQMFGFTRIDAVQTYVNQSIFSELLVAVFDVVIHLIPIVVGVVGATVLLGLDRYVPITDSQVTSALRTLFWLSGSVHVIILLFSYISFGHTKSYYKRLLIKFFAQAISLFGLTLFIVLGVIDALLIAAPFLDKKAALVAVMCGILTGDGVAALLGKGINWLRYSI